MIRELYQIYDIKKLNIKLEGEGKTMFSHHSKL